MNKLVTFGDIILRLSTRDQLRLAQASSFEVMYGGVEVNVASALSSMGVEASHITRLPENEIGRAAEIHFKKHGVDTKSFLWGGERIGLYYLEPGVGAKTGKVVYDRMGSSFCTLKPEMVNWSEVLKGATWFHFSGITPALSQGAAEACLEAVKFCKKNNITVSADINYRKNLWQYGKSAAEVMPELMRYTDIAIASSFDMNDQFGIDITSKIPSDAFQYSAEKLAEKFSNLKKIVTTFRDVPNASENHINSFLFENGIMSVSRKYIVANIVDRIGTGDAFAAGFIYGSMQNWSSAYTLDYAMSSMLLKHYIYGDQFIASVDEIKFIADGNAPGRLIR